MPAKVRIMGREAEHEARDVNSKSNSVNNETNTEQYKSLTPRGKKTIKNAEWWITVALYDPDNYNLPTGALLGTVRINDAQAAASPATLGRLVAGRVEEIAHKILSERKAK